MTEIRLPHITGVTEKEQLVQIKNYLYQLTGQLNFALKAVNSEGNYNPQIISHDDSEGLQQVTEIEEKLKNFIELKNLIIKSADVVEFFEDIVTKELKGKYVAKSDFGTYQEETTNKFVETSENVTNYYESTKEIIANKYELRKDGCYIKTGWLDDDNTIAGFEVGQYTEYLELDADGNEVTRYNDTGFAHFTTDEIAFFDKNRIKLAWFSKSVMHIANAQIEDTLTLGGYVIEDTGNYGIVFKWKGR
jgi:hypothetical protein